MKIILAAKTIMRFESSYHNIITLKILTNGKRICFHCVAMHCLEMDSHSIINTHIKPLKLFPLDHLRILGQIVMLMYIEYCYKYL